MQPNYLNITSSDTYQSEGQRIGKAQPTDFWETTTLLGLPAALWRLPNQTEKQLIVSFDNVLPRVSVDLDELPAGFVVSPFENVADSSDQSENQADQTLFLRADIQATFTDQHATSINTISGQITEQFWQTLTTQTNYSVSKPDEKIDITVEDLPKAEETYIHAVKEAIAAIERGEFRKVVLSRTKHITFANVPNPVDLFDKLCAAYPTAFVSAVSIPEKGQIWISATPERLVSIDEKGFFQTASLAGTQSAFRPDGSLKRPVEALWSQKEIEEQAIVSRYIIECFKKIRLREYIEEGPKTIIAGNLMHLGSRFTVDTQTVRYPQLGTVMLRLLHPTSAVCGTPRNVAMAFIRQNEPHDRELYSGFLGPVNMPKLSGTTTNLFVHIRCMKLEGKLATLYAGAGITEESEPEYEWHETEIKSQTLLHVIAKK